MHNVLPDVTPTLILVGYLSAQGLSVLKMGKWNLPDSWKNIIV